MHIEVKKLTPELADDYARFFDTTPHNNDNHGDKCYCVTFCRDNVYNNGGEHWYPTASERRTHGIRRVKDSDIQGYLAYSGGEVIGWCNANAKSDCQKIIENMRARAGFPVEDECGGEKTKCVFCFAIAPKMQRAGVAAQLLEFICRDAAADGFDFVEAMTHREFTQDGFRGVLELYEKCGFVVHAECEGRVVVRKLLK